MKTSSLKFVLAFTLIYGAFALAALGGQAGLDQGYRTAVADAGGDLQAPASIGGFAYRLASAE